MIYLHMNENVGISKCKYGREEKKKTTLYLDSLERISGGISIGDILNYIR